MAKWILIWASLWPAGALAQAAGTASAQAFAAVMQNSGHRQEVLSAAQATPAWQHMSCPGAIYTQQPEVGVYVPVIFDAAGEPVAGEWREGIIVSGCGRTIELNVLTKVSAPATLATGALLPGSTIADPVLQNAAQFYAVNAAGGLPSGCREAYVADTVFGGFVGKQSSVAGAIVTPWNETWTVNICGVVKTVALRFTPGGNGVAIGTTPVN